MSKSKDFPCREPRKESYIPNFKITPDNPLQLLKIYYNTTGNITRVLDEEKNRAMKRMVGTSPITRGFQIVHGVNMQVLTEHFKGRFDNVFRNRSKPFLLENPQGEKIIGRSKSGSLEKCWPATNIILTRHHIIPKSRGGICDESNYFWIPRDVHDDFHSVFDTLTPVEQLAFLTITFKQFYDSAFMKDMVDLLCSRDQKQFYRPGLVKRGSIEY